MAERFQLGALLGHVYTLESGMQVRLRLARSSDISGLRVLFAQQGIQLADFELARLVHFDPRRRYVVCATGLIDATETLLGIGAIALEEHAQPELLVVSDRCSGDVTPLLTQALIGAARAVVRSRAA